MTEQEIDDHIRSIEILKKDPEWADAEEIELDMKVRFGVDIRGMK